MIDPAASLPPGLLLDVHTTGVLGWGDVHVAQKLSYLYGETDQSVQLALAMAVRALRAGSTCLDLRHGDQLWLDSQQEEAVVVPETLRPDIDTWLAALRSSGMVTQGPDPRGELPLRLSGELLYLERYWQDESVVVDQLHRRRAQQISPISSQMFTAAAAELLSASMDPDQKVAAVTPAWCPVTVIAGGPGTGKTHTLARLLAFLHRVLPKPPLIALAAPTGKAAVRMQEALGDELAHLPPDLAAVLGGLEATTLHRLLGWVPGSRSRFQHHRTNPLAHDVVVVDEASMVNVTMMARLLDALRPQARLILVGDPDQLAPVEAGAVLADIVAAPTPAPPSLTVALDALGLVSSGSIVRLRHNHRSQQSIATLAAAVLSGDADQVCELFSEGLPGLRLADSAAGTDVRQRVVDVGRAMILAALDHRPLDALAALERHRLLCAHRRGPYGVAFWSRQVEEWLLAEVPEFDPRQEWYPGRPVMVTQNTAELGLFNGDTGVVLAEDAGSVAYFARGHGQAQAVAPVLLDGVQTIHAMTVHKAQGSQFDQVSIVLPSPESPLLTRELLYTALTRARNGVTVIGSLDALRQAVLNPARRASGLLERL